MGSIRGVISSLATLAAKLQSRGSSSSSASDEDLPIIIEEEINKLMRTLERIRATLHDAEEREIRDLSVKLWLKELKEVAYAAEDVLDEYQYEILRTEVEARNASAESSSLKRKKFELPDGMANRIKKTMSRFVEVADQRVALKLHEDEAPRRLNNEMRTTPTSHMVVESNIFGRENEKDELVKLLCSNSNSDDVVSVVTIVGKGGLGKTSLAQLVYNDPRVKQKFDLAGWVCVSEDFNVQRLTRNVLEFMELDSDNKEKLKEILDSCGMNNFSVLQEELKKKLIGKSLFLVLDDVWNEKISLWELFLTPFLSTKFVKILVTTRNEPVARIMQTIPSFKLGYLPEDRCWQLFQHYAFGGVKCIERWKLEVGYLIMKKCGMLPLAVKSIASLLRNETNEDSWTEILENELWESDFANEIFPPLQISYSRLPSYLKPCLIYCSMFPKDYVYDIEDMTYLWCAQGYLESKRRKSVEVIGQKYADQLFERSFFDCSFNLGKQQVNKFKLHDMIHDLARSNSENECYSIEQGKSLIFPKQTRHLFVRSHLDLVKSNPSSSFRALRTLIMGDGVQNCISFLDPLEPHALRSITFQFQFRRFEFLNSISTLKLLRYISLKIIKIRELPESICSLYNLQNLTINAFLEELPNKIGNLVSLQFLSLTYCNFIRFPEYVYYLRSLKALKINQCSIMVLPEHIGNLASLEELVISLCANLIVLPNSLCQLKTLRKLNIGYCKSLRDLPDEIGSLTSLQTLIVQKTGVGSLPPSINKLTGIQKLDLDIDVEAGVMSSWLNHIVDLKGTLCITNLTYAINLIDAQLPNIKNKHNLESLYLKWDPVHTNFSGSKNEVITNEGPRVLTLNIKNGGNGRYIGNGMKLFLLQHHLLEMLQPRSNLVKLTIDGYRGITFPKWVGDPISCASFVKLSLVNCMNIRFVPFSYLHSLKHLEIKNCSSLYTIQEACMPSQLEKLVISGCQVLPSVRGIQKLKSLVELEISHCSTLKSFVELRSLMSLRILKISNCPRLGVMANPVESCHFEVRNCPMLKDWCLKHNISYSQERCCVEKGCGCQLYL